jgi:hypothetical protein
MQRESSAISAVGPPHDDSSAESVNAAKVDRIRLKLSSSRGEIASPCVRWRIK